MPSRQLGKSALTAPAAKALDDTTEDPAKVATTNVSVATSAKLSTIPRRNIIVFIKLLRIAPTKTNWSDFL